MVYYGKTKHIWANLSQVKVVLIKNCCDLFWGASSDTMESQYIFIDWLIYSFIHLIIYLIVLN